MTALLNLLPGFATNLVVIFIIVRLIYYPVSRNRQDYIFTFFIFSILIYFIAAMLNDVEISTGFGFGLFAVFSMLRYRTRPVPPKEMTYLFICITIPLMNTLFLSARLTYIEVLSLNAIIILLIYILEQRWGIRYEVTQRVLYEKIELIKPENHALLMADLRERTGLDIKRYKIGRINLLRDTVDLTLYYDAQEDQPLVFDDSDDEFEDE